MYLWICLVSIIVGCFSFLGYMGQSFKPEKLEITAPFSGVKYTFNNIHSTGKEQEIAWKLYVQLETRKAALPIDENNDIIVEIYDSWYNLFTSTREYLINIPPSEIRGNKNAEQIVSLSLNVLNEGLRPHLTVWQGKYRKWYDEKLKDPSTVGKTPQEIQRTYDHYRELMDDMKYVNGQLRSYADQLKEISIEEQPTTVERMTITVKEWARKLWDGLFGNDEDTQVTS